MSTDSLERAHVRVLESQARLNDALAKTLRSVALQADRYDAELTELRATSTAALGLAEDAHRRLDRYPGAGSVRVDS